MQINDKYGLPIWPAAERNKEALWKELRTLIPKDAKLFLEIASGTGQHALHFAEKLSQLNPHLCYQPTDCDQEHLDTLEDRVNFSRLKNLRPPLRLNAGSQKWPLDSADFIFNANMIHVAPFSVTEGLMKGAARLLSEGQLLVTFGPYKQNGKHASKLNEKRDRSLHKMHSSYGVRNLEEVSEVAESCGFFLKEKRSMAEHNLLLVWQKS